jgi:hypothetical protein
MAVVPKIHTLVLDNSVDLAKHLNGKPTPNTSLLTTK